MQLGFGLFALGTAKLLNHRLVLGLAVGAPGAWLLWVVRPHLLAMAMCAAAVAYFFARSPKRSGASVNASLMACRGRCQYVSTARWPSNVYSSEYCVTEK